MPDEVYVSVVESEPLHIKISELERIVVQPAEQEAVNVRIIESEKISVSLCEPEAINVTIVGSLLGHGITSPITDHGDVETSEETENDLLLFNSEKKKYENRNVLSFDINTDEVIIT
ncbi:unnamed protein product, partial [marine sediment metagenome]